MLRIIGTATGLALLMAACGGGGGDAGAANYSIGGTVTGLTGPGLVLQTNLGDQVAVSSSGAFTFGNPLGQGVAYTVTIKTQPSNPPEICVITNGSGTVGAANVTSVAVACTASAVIPFPTVGGVVTGLTGSGLVLELTTLGDRAENASKSDLTVNSAGTFNFSPNDYDSDDYEVTVQAQPSSPTQNCVVTNESGTAGTANISNISVVCSGVGRFAYVTDSADNAVSVYAIDSTTGALTAVGTPVPTGNSPFAIVGSPDRQHLYVVNAASNNISVYSVNDTSGALTEISGSPFPAGTNPQALVFDSSGSSLYVANTGSNNLSAYAVDASTGALTPLPTATYITGSAPTAIATDRAGKFVFVANHSGGTISVFALTAATGALTPVPGSPFPSGNQLVGGNPLSMVFVDTPGFYGLYASTVDPANGAGITAFNVNPATGALTLVSMLSAGVDHYLAVDPNGQTLFDTSSGELEEQSIAAGIPLDTSGGELGAAGNYLAGTDAYSVAVDPSNQFIYVVNHGAGTISGFARTSTQPGEIYSLKPIPGSPFTAGNMPAFIAIL